MKKMDKYVFSLEEISLILRKHLGKTNGGRISFKPASKYSDEPVIILELDKNK